MIIVNLLTPLALDRNVFPCRNKKNLKTPTKTLNSLEDLAHTVDERFVLAYPVASPSLTAPPWEETLTKLDFLLAECRPLLTTTAVGQSRGATSVNNKSNGPQVLGMASSQSGSFAEINSNPSHASAQSHQIFSPSQSDPIPPTTSPPPL